MIGSPIPADLALFFLVGFLGGAHCLGMCGPLVTLYGSGMRADGTPGSRRLTALEVRQHGLFNLGRTASYTIIGAFFGLLGSLVYVTIETLLAVANPVRGGVGVFVGLFIVVLGGHYLIGRSTAWLHRLPVPALGTGRVHTVLKRRVDRLAGGPGIVGLGALHGLFPCPMLYAAFLYAFTVGDPIRGAVLLAALGFGTIPAVFSYGLFVDAVKPTRQRLLYRLLGVVFVVLGYVLLAHGLASFGVHLPHPELPHYLPSGLPSDGHGHH